MADVDDYFDRLGPEQRSALRATWDAAKRHAPGAQEAMSYGMPTLKHKARPLLGIAAHTQHLSVHPFSPAVITAALPHLEGFQVSKGTIRFTPDKPLPESVIAELIRLRTQEIE